MNLLRASLPRSMGTWLRRVTSVSNDLDFYSSPPDSSRTESNHSIELRSKLLGHTLTFYRHSGSMSLSTRVSLGRSMPLHKPQLRAVLKFESSMDGQLAAIGLRIYGGSGWGGTFHEPSSFNIRLAQEQSNSLPQLRLSFSPSQMDG
jgi:hypothetical protein